MQTLSSFLSQLIDGPRTTPRVWIAALALALLPISTTHSQDGAAADVADSTSATSTTSTTNASAATSVSNMEATEPELIYLTLGPGFISNYDGGARQKYLQADVSVRVDAAIEELVQFHLPAIRNRLVVLFSAQLEENLTSTQGREALRRQALEEIRDVLRTFESEAHSTAVIDVYFTSFVVQG